MGLCRYRTLYFLLLRFEIITGIVFTVSSSLSSYKTPLRWTSSLKVGEVLWGFPFVVGGTGQGSSNGDAELGNLSQVESC